MKYARVLVFGFAFILFVVLAIACGLMARREMQIAQAYRAIESMGRAGSVPEEMLDGPRSVSLSLRGLQSRATDEAIAKNLPALKQLSKVRHLGANNCPMSDAGLKLVIEIWGYSLEQVEVSHSPVSKKGVEMLLRCPRIKSIYASSDQIDETMFAANVEIWRVEKDDSTVMISPGR